MKKRLLTLAMAGVMVTAAMAPVAMAADTGTATVTYVTGAGQPGGSDGSYYVLFPADLTFFESTETPRHTVELAATTGAVTDLDATLSVNVNVTGKGILEASGYTGIDYQINYGSEATTFSKSKTSVDLTLTPTDATKEGTASITGTVPNAAKGTAFKDTLTFRLSENP